MRWSTLPRSSSKQRSNGEPRVLGSSNQPASSSQQQRKAQPARAGHSQPASQQPAGGRGRHSQSANQPASQTASSSRQTANHSQQPAQPTSQPANQPTSQPASQQHSQPTNQPASSQQQAEEGNQLQPAAGRGRHSHSARPASLHGVCLLIAKRILLLRKSEHWLVVCLLAAWLPFLVGCLAAGWLAGC